MGRSERAQIRAVSRWTGQNGRQTGDMWPHPEEFPALLLAPLSVPHDDTASPLLEALANKNRLNFEDLSNAQAATAFFKFFTLLRAARPRLERQEIENFREAISELMLHLKPKDRLESLLQAILHYQARDSFFRRKVLLPDWAYATKDIRTMVRMDSILTRERLLEAPTV